MSGHILHEQKSILGVLCRRCLFVIERDGKGFVNLKRGLFSYMNVGVEDKGIRLLSFSFSIQDWRDLVVHCCHRCQY